LAVSLFCSCSARLAPETPDAAIDATPVYSRCEDSTRATPESLAQKAATYDARLMSLHVGAATPWVMDVAIAAGVDPDRATSADVTAWRSGENDGLWNGLAIAAEAYRYAVTHDPAARAALATLLAGESQRARIAGVPGLLVRQMIPPNATALACPTDPALYVPSPTKTANRWVRIDDAGCAEVADDTGAFHATTHCGLGEFASWCFLDNISQDEYIGHIFGLGAVSRVVDDPELAATANQLLSDIAAHLSAHGMEFVDWDGRATAWGKLHPDAGTDSPGYLAVLGLSFLATAHADAYAQLAPSYQTYLDQIEVLYGCTSNWNDISMLAASFYQLIWNAPESDRAIYRAAIPALTDEKNAWFDFMYAAQSPTPQYAAVEDGVCQLREFPASNVAAAHDTTRAKQTCTGRHDESMAAAPFDVADRCAATFVWWGNPYMRTTCTADATLVQQPTGYLLPYWMGRYFGFIDANL